MSMSIQRLNTGMSPNGSKILVRRDYHSTKAIKPIRSSHHTDSQGHNLRISSKNKGPFFLGNPVLIASTPTPTAYPSNCGFDTLQRPPHGHRICCPSWRSGPPSKVELQINESVGVSSGPSRRRRSQQPTALPRADHNLNWHGPGLGSMPSWVRSPYPCGGWSADAARPTSNEATKLSIALLSKSAVFSRSGGYSLTWLWKNSKNIQKWSW